MSNRLIIIDGHAILYRAYHAIPMLTTPDGKPANAVFGFLSMLLRVRNEHNPTHLAIAFDRPGGTFRNELYQKYQAQRAKPDDDFIIQIGMTEDVLEKIGFAVFGLVGYEADDVIGTIAKVCSLQFALDSKENEIIIVTSDRDQLQLVSDHVKLLMPKGSLGETMLYGQKETIERMGVGPRFISDFKGLAGDPSDNIPGVAGIGPKTASDLINQFGSLEEIYAHLDDIKKEAVREKLKENQEIAFLSKKLATIVTDAPVDFDLASCRIPDLVTPQTVEALHALGFTSLVKRLTKGEKKNVPHVEKTEKVINDNEQMGLF